MTRAAFRWQPRWAPKWGKREADLGWKHGYERASDVTEWLSARYRNRWYGNNVATQKRRKKTQHHKATRMRRRRRRRRRR